jgi:phenylpropionate dioxygenase-like ring-hydroxylating dioxygenase large terminal subunit
MSDLANAPSLTTLASQLPVSWYLDPAIHDLEQRAIFAGAAQYMGHELMVPNPGDYHALGWMGNGKLLAHNDNGIELLSNVCRHRQAIMMKGRGNARRITCPLHRWTYDLKGQLEGAPHFPENPCLHLARTPLQSWNGLLFAGQRNVAEDLAGLGVKDFDFAGYRYHNTLLQEYQFDWKTFIEVYLEDYHVVPFHPGLGHFVDCNQLRWEFGEHYSVQTVGVWKGLKIAGSPVYERWHKTLLDYNGGKPPRHGAIWMVYYPNITLEWYPHVLVISTAVPRGPGRSTNVVEFYYPEDIIRDHPDFIEAEQAAYLETAVEDEDICQRMHDGRAALLAEGQDQAGPYQSPTEDGMAHFHAWVRRQLEPHLK